MTARGDIYSIGPDRITAAQLATRRQQLLHEAAPDTVPPWGDLTELQQQLVVTEASGWLAALAEIAPDWTWKVG